MGMAPMSRSYDQIIRMMQQKQKVEKEMKNPPPAAQDTTSTQTPAPNQTPKTKGNGFNFTG